MAVRITGTGATRTYEFSVTATSQIVLDIAEDAAHFLWSQGRGEHGTPEAPVTWAQLTNAQKFDVLDQYHKTGLRNLARSLHSNVDVEQDAVENLRTQRTAEAQTKYNLG